MLKFSGMGPDTHTERQGTQPSDALNGRPAILTGIR